MLGAAIAFLAEHADVIGAIEKAIAAGAEKQALVKAIEQVMVEASNAEMRRELGGQ